MYFAIETTKGGIEENSFKKAKQKYLQLCFDYNEVISIDAIIGFVNNEREKFLNQFIESFEEDAAEYISSKLQHPDEAAKEALSLMGWKN